MRFRGVPSGRYDVSVHCPGHVLVEGPTQLVVSDRELEVEWTAGPGLALTVNVEDATGKPVPDLPLVLVSDHDERPGVQRVTTITSDESGGAVPLWGTVQRVQDFQGKVAVVTGAASGIGRPMT